MNIPKEMIRPFSEEKVGVPDDGPGNLLNHRRSRRSSSGSRSLGRRRERSSSNAESSYLCRNRTYLKQRDEKATSERRRAVKSSVFSATMSDKPLGVNNKIYIVRDGGDDSSLSDISFDNSVSQEDLASDHDGGGCRYRYYHHQPPLASPRSRMRAGSVDDVPLVPLRNRSPIRRNSVDVKFSLPIRSRSNDLPLVSNQNEPSSSVEAHFLEFQTETPSTSAAQKVHSPRTSIYNHNSSSQSLDLSLYMSVSSISVKALCHSHDELLRKPERRRSQNGCICEVHGEIPVAQPASLNSEDIVDARKDQPLVQPSRCSEDTNESFDLNNDEPAHVSE